MKTQGHLCNKCNRNFQFPNCMADDVKFDMQNDNDDIVECSNYIYENKEEN